MTEVFVVQAARTPIGKFGGSLKDFSAPDLGAAVVSALLDRAGVEPARVDELIFGCGRQAGSGPNVARQVLWRAGIPQERTAYTVNMACASSLKCVVLAAQEIALGHADCVVAGGAESMSRLPFYLETARWGVRLGTQTLVDGMYRDGFLCPLSRLVMGETAELLADEFKISRAQQDAFALESQHRAQRAITAGRFDQEIIPINLQHKVDRSGAEKNAAPGKPSDKPGAKPGESFTRDEHPRFDARPEDLERLSPVFSKNGTITAGNSSGITDGAAAVLLMSKEAMKRSGLDPLARFVDATSVGVDPRRMGLGPVPAVRQLLDRLKMKLDEFDLVELNEAFAAQVLACDRELRFDHQRLNVNGGAIALGHPIGATGARIVVTLLQEMQKRGARRGLATLCVSGGLGMAAAFERP
ncbi:MAG: thiolase family protein [Acidobacteriia bacterium]|nr:thiolase family protein [Terriglobia bacterium]